MRARVIYRRIGDHGTFTGPLEVTILPQEAGPTRPWLPDVLVRPVGRSEVWSQLVYVDQLEPEDEEAAAFLATQRLRGG